MKREGLKENWDKLVREFSLRFADGDEMDLDGILFLIGVQEVSNGQKRFKKDEKVQLMHVAICCVLEPYGYYKFAGLDDEGWPHYDISQSLPILKPGEQSFLMKEAVVQYCSEQGWLDVT
jgi:hypothetical protein